MTAITDFIKALEGKKTYIIAAAGAVVFALAQLGYITAEQAEQIYTLLGIGAVATIRAALKK